MTFMRLTPDPAHLWRAIVAALGGLTLGAAQADARDAQYPRPGSFADYRIADRALEIRLAESAAPLSISGDARILVLGKQGFEEARKGTNGFTCVVQRSWASDFDDPEFWNPRIRAPICFNRAAARSVLAVDLERTRWALRGLSRDRLRALTRMAVARREIGAPEVGSMCFMMSRLGYLSDKAGGHWHPHLMYFLPPAAASAWGANLPGSPVIASSDSVVPVTVYLTPVPEWSDGTAG